MDVAGVVHFGRIVVADGRGQTFEDLIHVFQAFAPIVPESVEAIARIGAFVKVR